jgi:hypothetical protein
LAGLALLALGDAGCTRKFWRKQADAEVDALLTSKNCYDAWKIEEYRLPPDGRARFADPNPVDRPPMPPDDPGAKALSPNPQKPGKAGIDNPEGIGYLELMAAWDAQNRANRPPEDNTNMAITVAGAAPAKTEPYDQSLQSKEKGFLLTVDQSTDLALFNSREFQDQRENLYLAALPVTLERFSFAFQFFATEAVIREYTGPDSASGEGNRWRANSGLGFQKLFPTGALLLFRFANQVIVNMAATGTNRVITPSTISMDFTQPLLKDGGRAVTLEPLTLTERNLLYQVRGYARFRKEFYVAIAGGGEYGNNFTPPTVLPPSGSALTEGFYPTLLRAAILENEKQNVAQLESILTLYKGYEEGGDVSKLQVDQVELDLLNGRATVLQRTQELRDALDRFKLQLGVPPSVPIELDDSPLKPLVAQQTRFLEIVRQYEAMRELANRTDWPKEPEKLRGRLRQTIAEAPLTTKTRFATEFLARWSAVETISDAELAKRLDTLKSERRDIRAARTEAEAKQQQPDPALLKRLDKVERDIDLHELENSLRKFLLQRWNRPGLDETRRNASRANAYRDVLSDFIVVLVEAREERLAQVQKKWPDLPPVTVCGQDLVSGDLDEATATASRVALENRLDLMNARAKVVDAWRQIAVRANALMGFLNVRYHLDGANFAGTQPFDFNPAASQHQLIIDGELPLVRLPERNQYRAALINFQRNRRILQKAEDDVLVLVRAEIRQLRFLAENYRIQQRSVELAYYQVENALNTLQAPPRVVPAGQSGGSDSGSQAALTQQLLNAVRSLLRAQNQLFAVYQSYLVTRMQLYRDLEQMPLDRRGVWIDDIPRELPEARRADGPGVGGAPPRILIGPIE